MDISSLLVGKHNLENMLCAAGVGTAMKISLSDIASGLEQTTSVPGRLEPVPNENGYSIYVDYAHTPDALRVALEAAREHCAGELVCVFGCGGDRDRGKRPLMGGVADRLADRVILTDDNPRSEDGDRIIDEIMEGMNGPADIERDRESAIRMAISAASEQDLVLIAGKGHEDYQINGDEVRHFSDRETVEAVLEELAS